MKGPRVGVVVAEYNPQVTGRLLHSCLQRLKSLGVPRRSIAVLKVPGSYELPLGALALGRGRRLHAIICLGCILKGDTDHDKYIARWASVGIGLVSLKLGIPVVFGVITPRNRRQALERSGGKMLNRGFEAAETAVKMARLMNSLGHPATPRNTRGRR